MGSLADSVLKGHAQISGTLVVNGNLTGSINGWGKVTFAGNAPSASMTQFSTSTKHYLIGVTTSTTGNQSVFSTSTIYVTGSTLVSPCFSATASNSTKLGGETSDYYAPSTAIRQWWRYSGEESFTKMATKTSVPYTNIYKMSTTTSTAVTATSTTIKKYDYVFSDTGSICFVAAVDSTSCALSCVWKSAKPWTCLEEGTMITMADWSRKPIEDVQNGDLIMGYDFENNEPTPAVAILSLPVEDGDHANYLIFDDGNSINCTDCHEFYSLDRQRPVWLDELHEGEKFMGIDGSSVTLKAMHKRIFTFKRKQYYQLISSNNTYFANGVMNAMRPMCKYNWIIELMKMETPDEILEILKADSEEASSFSFLVDDNDFLEKSLNYMNETKKRYNRMSELIEYLKSTDYISFKKMEGIPIDESIIEKRQSARDEINKLEEVSKNYNLELDSMIKQHGSLGDDMLMPLDEKLSKYFKISCKRDNDNFELFKKYYCDKE